MSEVQWIKDGNVITINATVTNNGSRVTNIFYNESLSQLSITSASLQDSGNYTCNVTNNVTDTTDSTSIVIQGMYTMFITSCTTYLRHYFSQCSWLNFFVSLKSYPLEGKANPAVLCKHNYTNLFLPQKKFSRQNEHQICLISQTKFALIYAFKK